jgi:hypothetical protein
MLAKARKLPITCLDSLQGSPSTSLPTASFAFDYSLSALYRAFTSIIACTPRVFGTRIQPEVAKPVQTEADIWRTLQRYEMAASAPSKLHIKHIDLGAQHLPNLGRRAETWESPCSASVTMPHGPPNVLGYTVSNVLLVRFPPVTIETDPSCETTSLPFIQNDCRIPGSRLEVPFTTGIMS